MLNTKGKFLKCIPLYTIPYIQNIHCLHLYSLQCVDLSRSIINVSENQEEKNRFMRSGRRQGGHEPPLFPLPGHILDFFSSGWIFENHTLKALNIPLKKLVLPGRVKCGGTEGEIVVARLLEEKKANMWHGRGNSGGSWPPAFPHSLYNVHANL